MTVAGNDFSVGVEEEYQIVDPVSRELRPRTTGLCRVPDSWSATR